ncbi:MAG: PKD domain-containing protein [Candidatus Thermoplasmatota archaeon]|nr:PKD domain-containing protein [Candidatus Thermoplasmatota archaeon]
MNKKTKGRKILTLILGIMLLCIGSLILYVGHHDESMQVPLEVILLAFLLLGMGSVFLYVKKIPLPVLVIAVVLLMIGSSVSYVCLSPMYDGPDEFTVKAVAGEDRIVKVNETVVFNGSLSTLNGRQILQFFPTVFIWDFDASDGIKGDDTGAVVNHTYIIQGIYNVTLIVIVFAGACRSGYVDSTTISVTVVE